VPKPADAAQAVAQARSSPGAWPSAGGTTGWRAAFIVLLVVGALICLLGVLVFLVFGLTEAEGWTTGENWAFSAFCCLLPIGGAGLVLLMAGAGIWYARLRKL
jgi:ascorbate-specific PTS system EIIC-type component UlaA